MSHAQDNLPAKAIAVWEANFNPGSTAVLGNPLQKERVHVVYDHPPLVEWTRSSYSPEHQIVLFTSPSFGEERVLSGPQLWSQRLAPGDMLICSPKHGATPHQARTETGSFINVTLDPMRLVNACQAAGRDYAAVEFLDRFGTRDPLLENLVRAMGAEIEAGFPDGQLYVEQLIHTVAVHLLRHYTTGDTLIQASKGGLPGHVLRRVIEHLRARIDQEFSLEDLASEAHLSVYHFARQFKASVGEAPYQYLVHLRIEEAKRLLGETELPIAEIALAVGYGGQARLTSAFKRLTGTTPAQFRRDNR